MLVLNDKVFPLLSLSAFFSWKCMECWICSYISVAVAFFGCKKKPQEITMCYLILLAFFSRSIICDLVLGKEHNYLFIYYKFPFNNIAIRNPGWMYSLCLFSLGEMVNRNKHRVRSVFFFFFCFYFPWNG